MKRTLLFLLLWIGAVLTAQTQHLHYLVRLGNEYMGDMRATKTIGSKEKYLIESKINIDKMFKKEMIYKIESIYEKNILQLSSAYETSNGKVQTDSETKRTSTGYGVKTKKEIKTIIHKGITYNICKLYFEEPVGLHLIWSDTFGEMLVIKPAGEHRYELILPNGKKSYYSYFKGICTSVETEIMFGRVSFTLTK